jgi:hypothetical protein
MVFFSVSRMLIYSATKCMRNKTRGRWSAPALCVMIVKHVSRTPVRFRVESFEVAKALFFLPPMNCIADIFNYTG